jgi:HEAT repeat protein
MARSSDKPSGFAARVLALLDHPRVDVRCAAALVLGAAGRGDARAQGALAAHLADADPTVRRFVLEGLEAAGAHGVAEALIPLLAHGDEESRGRALRLLEAEGSGAEPVLRAALTGGDKETRRRVAALLGKIGTRTALAALVRSVGDADIADEALHALRAAVDAGKGKAAVAAEASRMLARKPSEAARAHLLRAIGYVGDPGALPLLAKAAQAGQPGLVRASAIAAMRRLLPALKKPDAAVEALLAWADDPDPAVAHAAVDTLRGAPISPALAPRLAALADANNADARRLAVERMTVVGTRAALAKLVAALAGGDPGARAAAARALAAAPEAAGALAEALAAAKDAEVARRLALALRPHEKRVSARAADALAAAVDGPAGAVVQEVLARIAPGRLAGVLFACADRLAKKGQLVEAFAALRPLVGAKLTPDERLRLAVMGLRARGTDLHRTARSVDPVLLTFRGLAREGYPLVKALRKHASAEEMFALGWSFVESAEEDDRETGRELLEAVIEGQPRGKLAVAARNKLKLSI